jgi:hypothetical protein
MHFETTSTSKEGVDLVGVLQGEGLEAGGLDFVQDDRFGRLVPRCMQLL